MPPGDAANNFPERRQDMERRADIGIAMAILMKRLNVDRESAFSYLEGLALRRNHTMYEEARELAAPSLMPRHDGKQ
jgi:AmiR/NasT family two-component response regulator